MVNPIIIIKEKVLTSNNNIFQNYFWPIVKPAVKLTLSE